MMGMFNDVPHEAQSITSPFTRLVNKTPESDV